MMHPELGWVCVNMPHGKFIAYTSRKLKIFVKNYPTYDLELEAVVFSLKIWRHYLYGVHVDVIWKIKVSIMYTLKRS